MDETVYITEAQFEQLSAKTGTWDCMDLCALQNTGFNSLTSCEVGSAESAVGIDDTAGLDTAGPDTGNPGFIWLVTCTGTRLMDCM